MPSCPYCGRPPAPEGPACAGCGAAPDEACLALFGRCPDCRVPLSGPRGLPRLPQLARLLGELRPAAAGPAGEGGLALVLDPPLREARERVEAALVLASLLGSDDLQLGRQRLTGLPDTLLRLEDAEEGRRACARLAEVGLAGRVVPLPELIAPLEEDEVVDVDPGPPVVCRDAAGQAHVLEPQAPRLIVTAQRVRQRRPRRGSDPALAEPPQVEPVAYVFERGRARPLLLRGRHLVRVAGLPGSPARRLGALVELLGAGPGPGAVPLEGARLPALLTPASPGGDELDNTPGLSLAARLIRVRWVQDEAPAAGIPD